MGKHNKNRRQWTPDMGRHVDEQYQKKATPKHYQQRVDKGWEMLMKDVRKMLDSNPVANIIKICLAALVIYVVAGIIWFW